MRNVFPREKRWGVDGARVFVLIVLSACVSVHVSEQEIMQGKTYHKCCEVSYNCVKQ